MKLFLSPLLALMVLLAGSASCNACTATYALSGEHLAIGRGAGWAIRARR